MLLKYRISYSKYFQRTILDGETTKRTRTVPYRTKNQKLKISEKIRSVTWKITGGRVEKIQSAKWQLQFELRKNEGSSLLRIEGIELVDQGFLFRKQTNEAHDLSRCQSGGMLRLEEGDGWRKRRRPFRRLFLLGDHLLQKRGEDVHGLFLRRLRSPHLRSDYSPNTLTLDHRWLKTIFHLCFG